MTGLVLFWRVGEEPSRAVDLCLSGESAKLRPLPPRLSSGLRHGPESAAPFADYGHPVLILPLPLRSFSFLPLDTLLRPRPSSASLPSR